MTDAWSRQDIADELRCKPGINAADIGVAVESGTVTFSGHVQAHIERYSPETVVKRVKGGRAIAQEIEVRPAGSHLNADDEIANRAPNVLRSKRTISDDQVQVRFQNGAVVLSGEVQWHFQNDADERTLQGLTGMRSTAKRTEIRLGRRCRGLPAHRGRIEARFRRRIPPTAWPERGAGRTGSA